MKACAWAVRPASMWRAPSAWRKDLGPGHTIVTMPGRLRQPLSSKAVQSGIPARKGPARAALADRTARADHRSLMNNERMILVSTEWLAASSERGAGGGCLLVHARRQARPPRRIRGGAYSRRGVLRHRRHRRSCHRPAAHDAAARRVLRARCGALGIGDDDMVVVYDGAGMFSAPRVWWMLKAMGHDKVAVLDGGFPKWKARRPRHRKRPGRAQAGKLFTRHPEAGDHARLRCGDGRSLRTSRPRCWMRAAPAASRRRSRNRAPACAAAICPAPLNVPWRSVLAGDGTLEDDSRICAPLFAEKGVDLRAPIVTTCGSGITAAILMLALDEIGARRGRAL